MPLSNEREAHVTYAVPPLATAAAAAVPDLDVPAAAATAAGERRVSTPLSASGGGAATGTAAPTVAVTLGACGGRRGGCRCRRRPNGGGDAGSVRQAAAVRPFRRLNHRRLQPQRLRRRSPADAATNPSWRGARQGRVEGRSGGPPHHWGTAPRSSSSGAPPYASVLADGAAGATSTRAAMRLVRQRMFVGGCDSRRPWPATSTAAAAAAADGGADEPLPLRPSATMVVAVFGAAKPLPGAGLDGRRRGTSDRGTSCHGRGGGGGVGSPRRVDGGRHVGGGAGEPRRVDGGLARGVLHHAGSSVYALLVCSR